MEVIEKNKSLSWASVNDSLVHTITSEETATIQVQVTSISSEQWKSWKHPN